MVLSMLSCARFITQMESGGAMRAVIKMLSRASWCLSGLLLAFPVWAQDGLYVPAPGSAERKAIMDAAHAAVDSDRNLHFVVKGLKVFAAGDRAIAVAWLTDPNAEFDNGGFFYFEQKNNLWKARYATNEDGGSSSCSDTARIEDAIIAGVKNIGAPVDFLDQSFYDAHTENQRDAKDPDMGCAMSDAFE